MNSSNMRVLQTVDVKYPFLFFACYVSFNSHTYENESKTSTAVLLALLEEKSL